MIRFTPSEGKMTTTAEKVCMRAYEDLRYAFYNAGYPHAGSFIHVCNYGHFDLTEEEFKEIKDGNSPSH